MIHRNDFAYLLLSRRFEERDRRLARIERERTAGVEIWPDEDEWEFIPEDSEPEEPDGIGDLD